MSIIVNIDTASERALVSFAKDGLVIDVLYSESQKEHASFLQTAIQELSQKTGIILSSVDAIAVTVGPGSYTGLRVGMASAKGLCYALQKPLITINSLEALAYSALDLFPNYDESILLCPMIDARRMEVFTAVYKNDISIHQAPFALILDENSFSKELVEDKILFFGNGSSKWKSICKQPNALFEEVILLPESLSKRSFSLFSKRNFTELAYSEPFYLKDFQSVTNN